MPRNFHNPSLLLLCALAIACRSSGDFRARTLPDPVPVHDESGRGYFLVELQSLARHAMRVRGRDEILRPGGSLVFEAELEAGRKSFAIELQDAVTGRTERLEIPVHLVSGLRLLDLDYPLPRLGKHEVRITAGFDAPNHRRPGRRLALDLVPALPDGESALGTEVFAPFRAQVIAFTEEERDRPGAVPNEILLRDERGRVWRYAHFQQGSIPLQVDRWVEKGQLLGRIGLSGRTTGPHLHIELLTPPHAR